MRFLVLLLSPYSLTSSSSSAMQSLRVTVITNDGCRSRPARGASSLGTRTFVLPLLAGYMTFRTGAGRRSRCDGSVTCSCCVSLTSFFSGSRTTVLTNHGPLGGKRLSLLSDLASVCLPHSSLNFVLMICQRPFWCRMSHHCSSFSCCVHGLQCTKTYACFQCTEDIHCSFAVTHTHSSTKGDPW